MALNGHNIMYQTVALAVPHKVIQFHAIANKTNLK
jgi:hypothetical protein